MDHVFLNFIGTIFVMVFFSIFSVMTISCSYESESRLISRILFIIQLMFLISSLIYFILSDITFSSNFIKHPINILPSILLLVSLVYFSVWIFNPTVDWLVVFGFLFILLMSFFLLYPILWASEFSYNINNNIINNKKDISPKNSSIYINIKSEKNLFNVLTSINDEDNCDYFVYNIYNKSLKNDKNISFKIKNIIVNDKKFDNTKFLCQSKHNIISYKIEKV